MLEHRLDALLSGDTPSLKDYADFVGLAERMPTDLLWTVLHEFPKMHAFLRGVIQKNLQERIPRETDSADLDRVVQEMQRRFPNIGQDKNRKT